MTSYKFIIPHLYDLHNLTYTHTYNHILTTVWHRQHYDIFLSSPFFDVHHPLVNKTIFSNRIIMNGKDHIMSYWVTKTETPSKLIRNAFHKYMISIFYGTLYFNAYINNKQNPSNLQSRSWEVHYNECNDMSIIKHTFAFTFLYFSWYVVCALFSFPLQTGCNNTKWLRTHFVGKYFKAACCEIFIVFIWQCF